MAQADDEDTPPGYEWVSIGDYLDRKIAEVRSPELALRLVRKELGEKQPHYRYLDRDGKLRYDDRNDRFWRKIVIDGATVVRPAQAVSYSYSETMYEEIGSEAEGEVKLFRVEVLVPLTEEKPASKTPIRTEEVKGFQNDRIDVAAKKLYPPDGDPPEGITVAELTRKIGHELARDPESKSRGIKLPSRDSVRRWLDRRRSDRRRG
jgi:hypothetical protein